VITQVPDPILPHFTADATRYHGRAARRPCQIIEITGGTEKKRLADLHQPNFGAATRVAGEII